MNLFILEDEAFIRNGLVFYFKKNFKEQLNIFSFSNGEEMIDFTEELMPDIVISDINLPGVNGIETIRLLKEQYQFKTIFLSGYNDYHYLRSAIKLGVEDYLLKPVDYTSLKNMVSTYIYEKQGNLYNQNKEFLSNILSNTSINTKIARNLNNLEYEHFHISLHIFLSETKVPNNAILYSMPIYDEEIIIVNSNTQLNCSCKFCFSFMKENLMDLSKFAKDLLLLKDIHIKQKELYNELFINFNSIEELEKVIVELDYSTDIKQKSDIILAFLIQYMSAFKDLSNFGLLKKISILSTQNYLNNEDIETIITNFIKPLILNLTQHTSVDSLFSKEVIQFIDSNYSNPDLCLNLLSSIFNKSSANLSIIIKNTLNKNFIYYLNEIRIEKAKKLLKDTQIKVYDVGKEVGYSNDEYFSKVFKKYSGVTPLKFRNLHKVSR